MIRSATPTVADAPGNAAGSTPRGPRPSTGTAYGWNFWYAYAANTAMMIAISLLFRYADFVRFYGGAEFELGWIVGAGMVGSLLMRLAQGVGIDTYGARTVWLWSAAGFVVSCAGHLWVHDAHSPLIYLLRIAYNSSIAGVFGASITYISRSAPVFRMAEVVGTLGTSGFIGMVTGTYLGDRLFGEGPVEPIHIERMFQIASVLGLVAFGFAWLATRGSLPPLKRKQPSFIWLVRRYHPGMVLLVGVAMGFGLGLPQTFLRPFAAELGIAQIALFFGVYTPTAFVTRMCIRRLPERIGIRPMILIGLSSLVLSMVLCLAVRQHWHLILPAVFLGIAHALLFPSVVAGGSSSFPVRYRGLGTTLVLAMFDLGNLLGAPTAGIILHVSGQLGLPRYSVMFFVVSVLLASAGLCYAWSSRGQRPGAHRDRGPRRNDRKRRRASGRFQPAARSDAFPADEVLAVRRPTNVS